ncbi:MAG: RlmE family RNA methyltransferase, partial [Alphaproteobacteria bacterium]|nr:RlmE family RNA methyltransferase [Alphaproteobacteria bacterium]
ARTKSPEDAPRVIGIDLLPIPAIAGATLLQLDFLADHAEDTIRALIPGGVDVVLSDMAPNTTGHGATDHIRIVAILEAAYPFACEVLKPGGAWVAKVFQGGAEKDLLKAMKADFEVVKHSKPKASRADSSEMYVVALGFKGRKK